MTTDNVLVVVAHPDDETLGCGGVIARHAQDGNHITVLTMTDGISSRGADVSSTEISDRLYAADKAMRVLGVSQWSRRLLPDQRLDTLPVSELADIVAKEILSRNPVRVYTHSVLDLNEDHVAVAKAVLVATRPVPGCPVRELFSMEVPSASEWAFGRDAFQPDYFVDISTEWHTKARALELYASEMRSSPHPRSERMIRSLHMYRGACVGLKMAEAFVTLRRIATGGAW